MVYALSPSAYARLLHPVLSQRYGFPRMCAFLCIRKTSRPLVESQRISDHDDCTRWVARTTARRDNLRRAFSYDLNTVREEV
jgi:hypothetical protein